MGIWKGLMDLNAATYIDIKVNGKESGIRATNRSEKNGLRPSPNYPTAQHGSEL